MRTFKFKLYRSKRTKHLDRQVGIAAAIWNKCIELHKGYYRFTGKFLPLHRLQRQLTKIKKRERYFYWSGLGSQAIQEIAERVDRGYRAFFRKDVKRPPKFRSFRKFSSFTLKQAGWGFVGDNEIRIGKKVYKYHKSRDVVGRPKTVTIKKNAMGEWFVFVVCDDSGIESKPYPKTGRSAGFDFGLKNFLTVNDGRKIDSPEFLKQALDELRAKSREVSTKVKGSGNWHKARIDLARCHDDIANRRDDWQWKLADELVREFDDLCFETLSMKAMQKRWGRKVSDLAFPEFLQKVEWLCRKRHKTFVKVGRWEPTSKMCSACGWKNDVLSLNDRVWECDGCGAVHDRDVNAAINILELGHQLTEEGASVTALPCCSC